MRRLIQLIEYDPQQAIRARVNQPEKAEERQVEERHWLNAAGRKPTRRDVISAALLAAPALLLPHESRAADDDFPSKDITFIIPYSAGGGFDNYVRAVAPVMESYLPRKVTVVPVNVGSGNGSRGIAQLYRAKPDGYTIGIFNIPGMFILQQEGGAGYDLAKFTWLGGLGRDEYGLGVAWGSPIKSLADLKALSETRPIKFTATGRQGTAYAATLIGAELLGIKAQLITGYKGSSDYVVGAIRGDGDAVVSTLPILRRMREGQSLRILATFEDHTSEHDAADATTLHQPELSQIVLQRLVGAPPGVPARIQMILADALAKTMADPQVVAWAEKAGFDARPATPDQAASIVRDQATFFEKWKSVLLAG
jgi:tripartite-type tricarboxylate transporter receptor subunit TctC